MDIEKNTLAAHPLSIFIVLYYFCPTYVDLVEQSLLVSVLVLYCRDTLSTVDRARGQTVTASLRVFILATRAGNKVLKNITQDPAAGIVARG